MTDFGFFTAFPLLPTTMIAAFALNHALTSRRADKRARADIRGLRAALAAELSALDAALQDVMALLNGGKTGLPSLRHTATVYRAHQQRLLILTAEEIEALVAAYAAVDACEAFLAATAKVHGTGGFRIIQGETPVADVAQRLSLAGETVALARNRLDNASSAQTRRWLARQITWRQTSQHHARAGNLMIAWLQARLAQLRARSPTRSVDVAEA